MQTRQNFLNYIEAAQTAIRPVDIPENGLSQLHTAIEEAELIIPVVGGFSAGKSSLINSFLGEDILPTAVTPETALATELRYSNSNYIEAITAAGTVERHELADFVQIKDNARQFRNLRLYLNNDQLKAIQPLVLVDMPGFDAPIATHNQAILNYLGRGVYFVFLNSVEDGNITSSMKREIDNLQQLGKGFTFCISKTNLRPSQDVAAVQETIAAQLADYFDHTEPVVLLDNNGGNNLKHILQAINPETLFASLFTESLQDNFLSLTQSIDLKISTLKGSQQESEDAISSLKTAITDLTLQKDKAISEIEARYSNHKITSIANKVAQALSVHKEQLVELAINNPSAFSREVNDLVKNNLLTEVQRSFKELSGQIIHDFGSSLKLSLNQNHNSLVEPAMVDRIQSATEMLLTQAASGLLTLANNMQTRTQTTGNAGSLYRVATTVVGLTTSVVAPVLEIVIIFLPDIIRFFTQGAQERKAREQVEKKILTEVIPEIKTKINEQLPETLNAQISALIEQIGQQFEAQLQQKRDEIAAAEAERQQHADELDSIMAALAQAKQEVTQAANRYLFARQA